MSALRLILGLLVAMVVVSFGVMNMGPVSVTYHRIGTYRLPLFYVLLLFFAAGFFVAWLGGLFDRVRFYTRLLGCRKEVRSLRRELTEAQRMSDRLLPPPSSGENGEATGQLQSSGARGATQQGIPREGGGNVSVD